MSTAAPFLGKMFIARDGRYTDPYGLDAAGSLFNVYSNGMKADGFTGAACVGVRPVTGPGKPSDLKHLMRGTARSGEPAEYVPLVVGADADTRTFGISSGPQRLLQWLLPADADIPPFSNPNVNRGLQILKQRYPAQYRKLVVRYFGSFGCRSANANTGYKFGDIQWWWGVGWNPGFDLMENRCAVYSYTPSAQDWRSGAVYRPTADYEWCDLSGEDYSHLSFDVPDYPDHPKVPRFGNADLTGTDFTGSNLAHVDFRNVYSLKHAKLTGAKLDGANLSGVDLTGTDLSGASLLGADLSNTDLTRAICNAPPALSHDINNRTTFAHATIPWHMLYEPARDGDKPDLRALVLDHATIVGMPAIMHHLDASNADLRAVVMSNMDLRGAKFVHARIEAIDLSGCMLAGASFAYAFLGNNGERAASLADSNLMDANFFNADLTGAVLTGAYLWGGSASLQQATLVQTDFANAYLAAVDFRGVSGNQCSGVSFDGACLVNANFNGTTTQRFGSAPTSFVNACLQGADFTGATLIDTNLYNASVSFGSGTFPAQVLMQWPSHLVPLDPPMTYDATKGLEAATTATTTCPAGGNGKCTDAQMHAPSPVTHWPPNS